jgi:predicted nucleic acid-binding protein
MARDLKLFVVDTAPLITLAVAQSLDYLLFINADIVIPDAVLHEATRDAARLGAQDIIDWVKAHRHYIEIAPTKAYEVYDAARATNPNLREPDLGEPLLR